MPVSLNSIENSISRQRGNLDAWLASAYADSDGECYYGEVDAGYEHWHVIESSVRSIFDDGLVARLSPRSLDSLLFFISRSDECGRIIAWLTPTKGSPLSWCGNLAYSDFLFLSEQAVARPDDYCDYQLAACYRKLETLDDRAVDILHGFFQKADSYTRRMALHSFESCAAPQTVELAAILWATDECEFVKLSCLSALKAFPDARHLFESYLAEYRQQFDVEAEEYRKSHIQALTDAT